MCARHARGGDRLDGRPGRDTGEAAFLPGVESRIPPRPAGSMLCSAPTVTPELLQTRK